MGDPSSFSNSNEITTVKASLALTADFHTRVFDGEVTYTFKALENGVNEVHLDCKDILILEITGNLSSWKLADPDPILGSKLTILTETPLEKGEEIPITIRYKTTEKCTAVQFMAPSQTAGKCYPFCYTQCEEIHCRTLVPIQDTPGIKFTVDYAISVRDPLIAVAAANYIKEERSIPGFKTFYFSQPNPIPAYLVAFAIGNIEKKEIGPRSHLYCEPEMMEKCAYEFEEIESLITISEQVIGKYTWGKLDLLVLPPSFPFGGMENPTLLFLTPTIIAGDRSLTNLVIHEITHAWTGNGVTNCSWEHFWLNEGFTVYFERKISGVKFGKDFEVLEHVIGIKSMKEAIGVYGETHEFTKLVQDLKGQDPDEAFSTVPYEKGCAFLVFLENTVGEELFLNFLRAYINQNLGKAVNSLVFKDSFIQAFPNAAIDWETWLYGPGVPPVVPDFSSSLLEKVKNLFSQWQNLEFVPKKEDIDGWTTQEIVTLLNLMFENPVAKYLEIGEVYEIAGKLNSEIRSKWLLLVIELEADKYYEDVNEFVSSIGRMKFIRPLYRAMVKKGFVEAARLQFERNKNFYNPMLIPLLEKDLSLK